MAEGLLGVTGWAPLKESAVQLLLGLGSALFWEHRSDRDGHPCLLLPNTLLDAPLPSPPHFTNLPVTDKLVSGRILSSHALSQLALGFNTDGKSKLLSPHIDFPLSLPNDWGSMTQGRKRKSFGQPFP